FTVQVNLLRILRGTMLPALSRRWPLSMMCCTRALTSTSSPFLACFLSSLMRGLMSDIRMLLAAGEAGAGEPSAAAATDRDLDLLAGRELRALADFWGSDDGSCGGETDAGLGLGRAARRQAMEGGDGARRM